MRAIGAALDRIDGALGILAGLTIAAIMAIVVVDVVGRYFLNAPLSWSYDLISLYLMVAIFYLGLSHCLAHGHHIGVDILFRRMSGRIRHVMRAISWLMAAVFFALLVWLAAGKAWRAFQSGEAVAGAIAWPTWVAPALVVLGSAMIVVRLVFGAVESLMIAAGGSGTGRPDPNIDIELLED